MTRIYAMHAGRFASLSAAALLLCACAAGSSRDRPSAGAFNCPLEVSLPASPGLPATWVGQEAEVSGTARGTNGFRYAYENRWVVIQDAAGALVWTGNGGRCDRIEDSVSAERTGGDRS